VSRGKVTTIILAAGGSTRLGRPKQLVLLDGVPLVARAARTALDARLGPVVVVLGADAEAVAAALGGLDVTLVRNPRWEAGMGTSIAEGVRTAAADRACAAVILMTCDQPHVPARHLIALAGAWRAGAGDAIGSAYGGTVGVPALFARARFGALGSLDPGSGAKALLGGPSVPCESCGPDLDRPDDLERF
jgi:CTP:molybdopterin cytidylyltransferase MocA